MESFPQCLPCFSSISMASRRSKSVIFSCTSRSSLRMAVEQQSLARAERSAPQSRSSTVRSLTLTPVAWLTDKNREGEYSSPGTMCHLLSCI